MRERDTGETLLPLDVSTIAADAGTERWSGIFFQGVHVGYSVSRVSTTADGHTLYEQRSRFQVATLGRLQKIITAGAAMVDAEGRLGRFDFFLSSDDVRMSAAGQVDPDGKNVHIDLEQGGTVSKLDFPVSAAPQISLSVEELIRRTPLSVGTVIRAPWFDPLTLSEDEMVMTVTDVEVLENGEEAWWMTSRVHDIETRSLVLPTGETLRQEGALGMSIVRMSKEEAEAISEDAEPVDLISLSAVQILGRIPDARHTRVLTVKVDGVDPAKVPNNPPLQQVSGDLVTVSVPVPEELPHNPIRDPNDDPQWLVATTSLPAAHPEIRERAERVVGDAKDRQEAVFRLVDFVYNFVEKVPTMGVPNGLEVLRTASGDCNEHTALFVSLARAAGIPSRIAAGVVFTDRIGPAGAFYYHAWPEVQMGVDGTWVPVDPTFGMHIADATHIKLAEGDLDRQVEIMGYLGHLHLELVELR